MKNLFLGVGLVACIVACKAETKSVSDASSANMPKAECCSKDGACTDKAKADCAGKSECSEKKACSAKPQG